MQVAHNLIGMMNDGQKEVMNELKTAIEIGTQKCVYIDGPGGTGKTFVLKAIYHYSRAFRKKVGNMAFSGTAAIVLVKGRTLHSLFKLPLDITAKSYSSLENKGKEADLIRNTDIFIWDEAPMASRHIMNIIDKKLKELMKNNKPFGGKTFILSGDVRQVLPIKRNATRTEIVDLLIKNSSLWPNFKTCKLTQNMRADPNEIEFAQQLIEIGDGKSVDEGFITIPDSCICETDLVEEIFGDIIKNKNYSELANRAILATLNTNVDDYNHRVLEAFPGEYLEPYFSFDETNPDTKFPVSLDILNAHNSSSLPDHALRLKKDCILMLMRNLNLKQGLSNGTRLQVVNPMKNVLQCIIITGHKKGETAFIPRITLIEDKRLPYILKRHQFPVKLAFAFSINKSQSQTFTKVGIDFQNEVFAHGQCYVALSRAKSWNGIKVVLDPENTEKKIRNIVWKEVLEN